MYEYLVICVNTSGGAQDCMNAHAERGWELFLMNVVCSGKHKMYVLTFRKAKTGMAY